VTTALAVARQELRLLSKDPFPPIFLVLVPVLVIALLAPGMDAYAQVAARNVEGPARAVCAGAVTFSFFLVGTIGMSMFNEHTWMTWDRVRASQARSVDILVGKAAPGVLIGLVQLALLFGFGSLVLGLRAPRVPLALVVVSVPLVVCVSAFALAVVGLARSLSQLNLVSYVGALGLGGIGGALTPLELMPGWIRAIAPATPTYWALRGYLDVFELNAGVRHILPNAAVLTGFSVLFGLVAASRLRFNATKST